MLVLPAGSLAVKPAGWLVSWEGSAESQNGATPDLTQAQWKEIVLFLERCLGGREESLGQDPKQELGEGLGEGPGNGLEGVGERAWERVWERVRDRCG